MRLDKTKFGIKEPDENDYEEEQEEQPQIPVNQGAIDKVVDLAFNASEEKIREVTVINRMQATLLPQLDVIDYMRGYCIEIATYREDEENYKKIYKKEQPKPIAPLNKLIYRTAQWQKSVQGKNLDKALEIARTEKEAQANQEEIDNVENKLFNQGK